MDALSEALTAVRATGAIFFRVECGAPWGFTVPPINEAAHLLAPGTERLVSFHLITEGRARVRLEGREDFSVGGGDMVILPHGAAHTVSNGKPVTFRDSAAALGQVLSGRPTTIRLGGGGETTRIVCGFIGCDFSADRLFLSGLPPTIRINMCGRERAGWVEGAIHHLVSETERATPGAAILLSKMAETLFVEALRRFMEELPPEQTGWLAGANDPLIGRALALLHRKPARRWTLNELAFEVGTSRSVLIKRFAQTLGDTPLGYLRHWRLQLAARLLRTERNPILHIAAEVGYESEAAFNRAFKVEFGMPPAQYRRQLRATAKPK